MVLSLGTLAEKERLNRGLNRKTAAAQMGVNPSTLQLFEQGRTMVPNRATMVAVETYYGWRRGVMLELWDKRRDVEFGDVTMDTVQPDKPTGLVKASQLSDQELMAELNFRFLMRDAARNFDFDL